MAIALPSYDARGFASFLASPPEETLDLSDKNLIDIIHMYGDTRSTLVPNAWKQYSSLRTQIRRVQEAFGVTLMPVHVNEMFWRYFISFMIDQSNYELSSIGTVVCNLKTILKWASRYRCKISPTFDVVKVPLYHNKQLSLTLDEVFHIYHYDISRIPRRKQYRKSMEQTRDALVLMCCLGQRHSDAVRIDRTCFEHNKFTIVQQKTGEKAVVDLDKFAIGKRMVYALLEKYNYKFPLTTKDVGNYNKRIKELLQYIGGDFLTMVKRERKVKGKIETVYIPRWQMVSSHTCRRTFVNINIMRGYSLTDIRKATGHHSVTAFERYECDDEDF